MRPSRNRVGIRRSGSGHGDLGRWPSGASSASSRHERLVNANSPQDLGLTDPGSPDPRQIASDGYNRLSWPAGFREHFASSRRPRVDLPGRLLRTQTGCALQPETRDPRIRWDGPRARRAMDQGRPASEYGEAGVAGWPSPAGNDTLSGVADGVGIVCDGCEPWQAQHLRFSRPRHEYLPARSRNGPAGAAEVSAQLFSDRQTSRAVDSRRHLVLGDGRPRRRAVERPHRTGDLSSRGRAQRRAARRTSPARHQGHDGHLLLLRDGSESIRRRQHRVRRDSETPVDGRRRRAHGARGTAEPADPSAGPGDSNERDEPQRSGSYRAGGVAGEGGHPAAGDDRMESIGADPHRSPSRDRR